MSEAVAMARKKMVTRARHRRPATKSPTTLRKVNPAEAPATAVVPLVMVVVVVMVVVMLVLVLAMVGVEMELMVVLVVLLVLVLVLLVAVAATSHPVEASKVGRSENEPKGWGNASSAQCRSARRACTTSP